MSPHAYTEDQLVEQPAIGLFADLGWQTVSAMEETLGPEGTLGRETKGEVVLLGRLRAALVKFNAGVPAEAIDNAIDELSRDRSAMSPEAANREIYRLMNKLTDSGLGIVMISSELPEILGMSDRVVVMREGRVTGELSRDEATQESIMHLATEEVAA